MVALAAVGEAAFGGRERVGEQDLTLSRSITLRALVGPRPV
jgi:hypothetical protein